LKIKKKSYIFKLLSKIDFYSTKCRRTEGGARGAGPSATPLLVTFMSTSHIPCTWSSSHKALPDSRVKWNHTRPSGLQDDERLIKEHSFAVKAL